MKALSAHGPCPEHRYSFVNVSGVACGDPAQQAAYDDPGQSAAWSDAGQEN
jgi:hypothetical protein